VEGYAMETGTPEGDLDQLVHIELTEIPRLRSALSDWVDDPVLASRMSELRNEADRLRLTLGLEPSY
jgi:hypothetical protein